VVLEPRKADVSVRMVGSKTTNESGMAIVQIEYPQSVAGWDRYKLTVSASGVSGTEGSASFSAWLDLLASELNDTDTSLPFQDSPYGDSPSCTNPN
jgi:hypothetical protein